MGRNERYDIVWYGKLWNEKFEKEIRKQYRISFCTTCMGRLKYLQQTLPFNIERNKEYSNLEFVILNYNSKDDMEEWMKRNMMKYIETGKVVYYKTTEPEYYSMTHSRNVAFKVSTGDIINNVDADNFTYNDEYKIQECWASYLNKIANQFDENILFAKGKQLLRGRIGFYKKDFLKLGGYDEDLEGYGYDDHDIAVRAKEMGFVLCPWRGKYFHRIRTGRKEKGENMKRPWKKTERENKKKSINNIEQGRLVANWDKHWGKAHLIKNFEIEMDI